MINRQHRLFKNYKKHGFQLHDKSRADAFHNLAIQKAKDNYLKDLGNKLIDPNTSQKSYWRIINRVMNKCKAPNIPPIII